MINIPYDLQMIAANLRKITVGSTAVSLAADLLRARVALPLPNIFQQTERCQLNCVPSRDFPLIRVRCSFETFERFYTSFVKGLSCLHHKAAKLMRRKIENVLVFDIKTTKKISIFTPLSYILPPINSKQSVAYNPIVIKHQFCNSQTSIVTKNAFHFT